MLDKISSVFIYIRELAKEKPDLLGFFGLCYDKEGKGVIRMIFGIAFLLLGIGALLQQLGYLPPDLDLFWAIIFIAIGLSIVFGKKKGHGHWCGPWCCEGENKKER